MLSLLIFLFKVKEPTPFRSAQKDPRWVAAMHEEIAALYPNHTWTIVSRPSNQKVIGCKWLYKRKSKSDGTIEGNPVTSPRRG